MGTKIDWIKCSDRLPDEDVKVLVTIHGTDCIKCHEGETLNEAIERMRKKIRYVTVGFIGEDGWYGADYYPMMVKPVAWAYLPEPWREE